MFEIKILKDVVDFSKEFERCCKNYNKLHIATAWVGNPKHVLPYTYLETFEGSITATVGVAFNQTHPDSLDFLKELGADLRVFQESNKLFHPKVYLFSSKKNEALFIGSSNFTYSGFFDNIEINVLVEGLLKQKVKTQISQIKKQLKKWHSDTFSFAPSSRWISSYRKSYEKSLKAKKQKGIKTPPTYENEIATSSWLRNADWQTYHREVIEGLKKRERDGAGYMEVLEAAENELPLPWEVSDFDILEKRKIVGGIRGYGCLGHVAASGQFRKLLASGTRKQKKTIVDVINEIGELSLPIEWKRFEKLLSKLIKLGPSIKVWGRLLCLIRPDMFCTVASISVRTNLSKTLKIPKSHFERTEGYIQLLKLIHSSPWFNSSVPEKEEELEIWERRVAFMDAIFY